jgi:hypothetical protein
MALRDKEGIRNAIRRRIPVPMGPLAVVVLQQPRTGRYRAWAGRHHRGWPAGTENQDRGVGAVVGSAALRHLRGVGAAPGGAEERAAPVDGAAVRASPSRHSVEPSP